MTQRSFETALKKGAIGESIVKERLEAAGWVVYQPVTEGAHAFDMLSIKGKRYAIACDVKAKALMNKWQATGVNQRHFEEYQQFSQKHSMPFWLFFVDEYLGEIYGNTISELEQPRAVECRFGVESFPKVITTRNGTDVRLWPYAAMKKIAVLASGECHALMEYNQRGYEYQVSV
jgi:hypothetical protein